MHLKTSEELSTGKICIYKCVCQIYNVEYILSPYKKRSDGCAESTPTKNSYEKLIKITISKENSRI
jgi:hypothetical protein